MADYCSIVYDSMLTDEQDETLDKWQAHALQCIFGKDISYQKMLELAKVPTLRELRKEHSDKFASKCLANPRFASWFPLKGRMRAMRGGHGENTLP